MGKRGAQLVTAGVLAVVGAGGLLGALALTGSPTPPPGAVVHMAVLGDVVPSIPAPVAEVRPAEATPAPDPVPVADTPAGTAVSEPAPATAPPPAQPQPAIGAPAGSRCGGVCGPTTSPSQP